MTLAKLATFFAVVFLLSIAVCGYDAHHSIPGYVGLLSLVAMVVSFFGLIGVGFVALFHIMFNRSGR